MLSLTENDETSNFTFNISFVFKTFNSNNMETLVEKKHPYTLF